MDLVRYMRGELHIKGLISDEEYAQLVQAKGLVARLESYDEAKAVLKIAQAELNRLREPPDVDDWKALVRLAYSDDGDGASRIMHITAEYNRVRDEVTKLKAGSTARAHE